MGNMHAMEYAALKDRKTALAAHFQSNHYPPLPLVLVPVALRVIRKANAGAWDARVKLPAGITYRGNAFAPVGECVSAWHLDAFLKPSEED